MPKKPTNPDFHAAKLLAALLKALEKDIPGFPSKLTDSLSEVDENDLISALRIVWKIQYPEINPPEEFFLNAVKEHLKYQ